MNKNIDISLALIYAAMLMQIVFSSIKGDIAPVILLIMVMIYLYLERCRANHYLSQLMEIAWSPDKE